MKDKIKGIKKHVYWYEIDYEIYQKRKENEIFKRVELVTCNVTGRSKSPVSIVNGNCNIPEVVTSIGISCFSGCSSLTSVQLPSSLRSIGHCAFSNTNVKSITIPEVINQLEMVVLMDVQD